MERNRKYVRQIVAFGDYFKDFKRTLEKDILKKIYSVFMLLMTIHEIPSTFFRQIKGVQGLYEIRVEEKGNAYRIFCCFDEGNIIILFNAYQKKTQKTPQREIDKAERIMYEYFKQK